MNPFRASALRAFAVEEPRLGPPRFPVAPSLLPGAVRAATPRRAPNDRSMNPRPMSTRPQTTAARLIPDDPTRLFSQLGSPSLEPAMNRCLKRSTQIAHWTPPPPGWASHLLPNGRAAHLAAATSRPITPSERAAPVWRSTPSSSARRIALLDPIHGVPFADVPDFSSTWTTSTNPTMPYSSGRLPRMHD